MPPVLPTKRIAHLGTADCCIHPPGRNEMIAITPPKIFSKEVAQNRPPHLPRQQPPSHQNYFHRNFQGWGPNENLKLKSPPYRGSAARLNEVGLAARAAPRLRTRPGAGITRETPTCSFPNAVGRSAPSASTASSSASVRPPRCHSRSSRTCFAMPVGSSSPTTATTRGPCSITSDTRTSSTPLGTPTWHPIGSRTFGGVDDGGAGSIAPHGRSSRSKKTTRHIVEVTRPLAVASCAECAPSG